MVAFLLVKQIAHSNPKRDDGPDDWPMHIGKEAVRKLNDTIVGIYKATTLGVVKVASDPEVKVWEKGEK
jgi:hypothetical protein